LTSYDKFTLACKQIETNCKQGAASINSRNYIPIDTLDICLHLPNQFKIYKVNTAMPAMYLSHIPSLVSGTSGCDIRRDGSFESLGYVSHRTNTKKLLAFVGRAQFIKSCVENPLVTAVLTTRELADAFPPHMGVLVAPKPMQLFYDLHHALATQTDFYWQEFPNDISSSAKISPAAHIAAKNVRIGPDTIILPGAIIHERTIIGARCVINSGTIVSSEGFEYKDFGDGLKLIVHGAGVEIGNDVNIHSHCAVDRGVFGENTMIGSGSCLDNFVHVAHGVKIGRNCIVTAGATFAAAVIVGDGARIDPNATVAHVKRHMCLSEQWWYVTSRPGKRLVAILP
jgi:UDP-3-O-[3-hydroxymyristoyl] glucosamine N-acyltransferase